MLNFLSLVTVKSITIFIYHHHRHLCMVHDILKPKGTTTLLRALKQSAAWASSDRKITASSAFASSMKHCSLTVIPTCGATWLSIQSMAMQNRAGANTHLWCTPDNVLKRLDSFPPERTFALFGSEGPPAVAVPVVERLYPSMLSTVPRDQQNQMLPLCQHMTHWAVEFSVYLGIS